MKRPSISRTVLRIGGSFAAVLALFGAALWVTLAGLGKLAQAQAEVVHLDHAKHAGHLAAAQVREQYIHQAHTIILWNESHLDHYEDAVRETRRRIEELRGLVTAPRERALAAEIDDLAQRNNADFRSMVLGTLREDDRSRIPALHSHLEQQVTRVVALNDELNALLEERSRAAQAGADALRVRTRRVIDICFLFDILLAIAVGVYNLRSVLRPVSILRAGAERVARGDLSARISLRGGDEFAELAATFNQMTADLARHQEDLIRAQRLASVGQVAAGVAHEINNPLGVILGYTKVLLKDPKAPREELGIIEEEARQCQTIVEGLLDVARPPRLDLADVDLADLAREEVERLRGAGKLVDRSARAPAAGTQLLVRGDEIKLRQVISNLLRNAVDATPAGGTINVEALTSIREAVLTVTDTGPGIQASDLGRIFDPFFTTKPHGSGLGLAVSQAIVAAHGGHIEARSDPPHGASFTVRLPLASIYREEGSS